MNNANGKISSLSLAPYAFDSFTKVGKHKPDADYSPSPGTPR